MANKMMHPRAEGQGPSALYDEFCPRCYTPLKQVVETFCPACGVVLPIQFSESSPPGQELVE